MSLVGAVGRLRPLAVGLFKKSGRSYLHTTQRKSGDALYREKIYDFKEPVYMQYAGTAFSAFMWYWILYHCYFEFEHLVPSHVYPDGSKFTDEELGIPPDDEE